MKFYFSCLLIFIVEHSFSQSFSSHRIELVPVSKSQVEFNDSSYRQTVIERYRDLLSSKTDLNEFADLATRESKYNTLSEFRFKSLDKENEYLRKVLAKTIPKEFASTNVKLHIVKDASVNANCYEDGTIHVCIGLLAELENEAELAAILSHEYGHYYQKHAPYRYRKIQNAEKRNTLFQSFSGMGGLIAALINLANASNFLIEQEEESDLFTVQFFKTNGYNSKAIISLYTKLLHLEKMWGYLKGNNRGFKLFSTHPSTSKRLKNYSEVIPFLPKENAHNFQIDSIQFINLKKRAVDECINVLYQENNLTECIRLSYGMYLQNPKDEFYLYYLLESLAKQLYINPNLKSKYFITENYSFANLSLRKKDSAANSIHQHLKEVYDWNDSVIKHIKFNNSINTDSLIFVTNKEAFDYFIKRASGMCNACYPVLKKEAKPYKLPNDTSVLSEYEKYIYTITTLKEVSYEAKLVPIVLGRSISDDDVSNSIYIGTINDFDVEKKEFDNYIKQNDRAFRLIVNTFFETKLNNREKQKLVSELDLVNQTFISLFYPPKEQFKKKVYYTQDTTLLKVNFEPSYIIPDLTAISKKYGQSKLIFIDVLNTLITQRFQGVGTVVSNALVYCVDFEKKCIYRKYLDVDYRHSPKKLNELFPLIFKEMGTFLQAVTNN